MHKMLDMHMHAMHFDGMKLDQYLSENSLTDAAFAAQVEMSQSQINRLKRGLSQPSWVAVTAIDKASNGQVSAKDWMRDAPEGKAA